MIHSKMPLKFWYWAAKQAAFVYILKTLGIKLPADAPTFGNRVLLRNHKGEDKSFMDNTREGIFLCWDASVIQGAYVLVQREDGTSTIIAASGPRPWPKMDNKETWHLEKEPDGDKRVWISNKRRIRWKTPAEEDRVTFEERTEPEMW